MRFTYPTIVMALLLSFIAAAAVPKEPTRGSGMEKRGQNVLFLANCWRENGSAQYGASYGLWYNDSDNTWNNQFPDSLSNEYRNWAAGGTYLTWEGTTQNLYFSDSGVTVSTDISYAAASAVQSEYVGSATRDCESQAG